MCLIKAFRAVFGVLFHSILHFGRKNYFNKVTRALCQNNFLTNLFPSRKKAAFTLAEILITLGIIGIIAALTIPNLIYEYRKKSLETGLVKFYSTINQAFKLSAAENGDERQWTDFGQDSCNFYKKYLAPYLKAEYECGYYESVEGQKPNKKNDVRFVGIYFPSGDMAVLSYGWTFTYTNQKKYYKAYPAFISGNESDKPELYGKEVFLFERSKHRFPNGETGGMTAYDSLKSYTENELLERCKSQGKSCTTLISNNGWKIPDNYPFKI